MTDNEKVESFKAKHPALFLSMEEATAQFLDSMGYDGYRVMSLTRPKGPSEGNVEPQRIDHKARAASHLKAVNDG